MEIPMPGLPKRASEAKLDWLQSTAKSTKNPYTPECYIFKHFGVFFMPGMCSDSHISHLMKHKIDYA
jgi:hypothetical protein